MKNGLPYIRRWMWLLLLIVIITVTAAFTFVYNEISNTLDVQLLEVQASHRVDQKTDIGISGIKLRIFSLLTGGLLTILLLSILWLRFTLHQINRPIQKLQRSVSHLAQGKLNETVDINSTDEFGQIGAGINELAANLQELLLYIWKQTGQCMAIVEEINANSGKNKNEIQEKSIDGQIKQLIESIENLREMAKAYVFYDVRLEGEKALAINHPGRNAPPGAPLIKDETSS